MISIVRNVRDIDAADRKALEHMVGQQLRENQQIIIDVVNLDVSSPASESTGRGGGLPDWCNVYQGLTEAEIDEIEQSIVRHQACRTFE